MADRTIAEGTFLAADPKLWGWTVPTDSSLPFEKDDNVEDPFSLILMGHIEQQGLIPDRLKKVVEVKADFDYNKYYDTIHQIGLVIPAFAKTDYYSMGSPARMKIQLKFGITANSASSSIAAAVLARVSDTTLPWRVSADAICRISRHPSLQRGIIWRHTLTSTPVVSFSSTHFCILPVGLRIEYLPGTFSPDNIDPIQAIGRLRSKGTTLSEAEQHILAGSTVANAYTTQRRNDDMLAMSEKVYKTNLVSMDKMLRTPLPDYSFM